MTKYLGKDFVVQVGDIAAATNFATVAAMRSTTMTINNETIDVTDKGGMPWRELLEGGLRSMSISLSGPISDAATLVTMRAAAVAGQIRYFKIVSGLGYTFIGKFQVVSLELGGEHTAEETYSLSLESSGEIAYTP